MNSPTMKTFADDRLADGESCMVVDLADCTGMDSTFMGTLAGMAARLAEHSGCLQIAEPGERNRRSLEDLGLDFLMEIDPSDATWKPHLSQIRSLVEPAIPNTPFGQSQRTRHVLEAHQTLADLNEQNAKTFATVVDLLQNELTSRQPPETPPTGG
jgi:anti-anti-sigma regulatory factor